MSRKYEVTCALKTCEKPPAWQKRYCTDHKSRRSRRERPTCSCGKCWRTIDLITDGIQEKGEEWHWSCYLRVG